MKSSKFSKAERLRRSADIQRVFRKGKKYYGKGIKLFILPNELQTNRVVFTFPKNFGNAIERNYSRRLCREAYRITKHSILFGYDLAILVFPGNDSFPERKKHLEILFRKAGLWSERHE